MTIYDYYDKNGADYGKNVPPEFHYPSSGTPMRSDAVGGIGTRRNSWYPGADNYYGPWRLPGIDGYIPGMPMRTDAVGARWEKEYEGQLPPYMITPATAIGAFDSNDMTGAYIVIGCLAMAIVFPLLFKG